MARDRTWAQALEQSAHKLGEAMAGQSVPQHAAHQGPGNGEPAPAGHGTGRAQQFRAEILPKLQPFPLRVICEATGDIEASGLKAQAWYPCA